MCLDTKTKLTEKLHSRKQVLCLKSVIRTKKYIKSYYRHTPLKIGQWQKDVIEKGATKLLTDYTDQLYNIGFHAWLIEKGDSISDIISTGRRIAIMSDIVARGTQIREPVVVGRRQYIVPRKEERAVLARFKRRLALKD